MGFNILDFMSTFCLCANMIYTSNGNKIELFRNRDFTGPIREIKASEQCTNNPETEVVLSFRTDVCIVLYWHPDCKSTGIERHFPTNYTAPAGYRVGMDSFHLCNDQDGGSQLNVDLTEYHHKSSPNETPNQLESYTRVCTCINIPDYIQKMEKWSINNHANEFFAYFEPDCMQNNSSRSKFHATYNKYTINIFNYTQVDRKTNKVLTIQSFGPVENSKYFKSTCQLYTLLSELKSTIKVIEKNVERPDLQDSVIKNDLEQIKSQRALEAVELANKFKAVDTKILLVEKSMLVEHLKLQDQFSQKINSVQTGLRDLQNLQKNESVLLLEKFHAVDIKFTDVENSCGDKIKSIKNKLEILSTFNNASKQNIKDLQNTSIALAVQLEKQSEAVDIKLDNLERSLEKKINDSKAKPFFVSSF